jgi:glycerol-3-phosphate acyltransferase PlsY
MGIISGAVAAYLVGCVPAARIASGLAAGRRWAPWAGALADVAKGFIAVWLCARTGSVGQALVVTAVVAGDQWPVFGRDVGRSGQWALLGAIAEVTPVAPPLWGLLWGIGFVASGYFAIGKAVATALLPPLLGFVAGGPLGLIALPGCVMVLERSRELVRRARAGEEPKHYWKSAS